MCFFNPVERNIDRSGHHLQCRAAVTWWKQVVNTGYTNDFSNSAEQIASAFL